MMTAKPPLPAPAELETLLKIELTRHFSGCTLTGEQLVAKVTNVSMMFLDRFEVPPDLQLAQWLEEWKARRAAEALAAEP